jgi:hypothetical protein
MKFVIIYTSLILFVIIFNGTGICQTNEDSLRSDTSYFPIYKKKYISILAGYNFWRYHYAEFGIAMNSEESGGVHSYYSATFVSCEIKIDNKLQIGPKIGGWLSGGMSGMAMGLNLIYYTDFDQASLRLRPEIGFGMGGFKMVYGYNFRITNKDYKDLNTHVISFAYLIKLKKLKTIDIK